MIQFQQVTKKFHNMSAVDSVSLQIKPGEIIGFLGPNGAGKTTTMRLLLGYLRPSSGAVSIEKKDPHRQRIAILKMIGYLPENNPLYLEMKVAEYLQFVASIKEVKKEQIQSVVEQVALDEVLETKIEELSRGFKQRVGLAAALIGEPKILILDEPTSGLDPIEQDRIKDLIKKMAKKKTVIFSTHILSEVEDVATRLMIINQGQIVYDGEKPKKAGGVEKLFKKLVKKE
ncbi:hypothetical protein A3F03_03490 [Candidatus Roizmanbacteria bacterium RIFCSPHIGHO2_12_FULL_41_11]|uniref:ABC transporter domain-containing protein n=3 Tax=Candidatus Roizmaniibacteriota TaxID=1752723 RepID=A0A1F7JR38_9BACT|nr:MAG: hypothetical protein A3F03_03490 [Candidatus Roizmanbacteria bacterium RIFCSPHIGHO2_12_FULL_41_11]OGK51715.1 MAG: hypothetical protein A2966_01165 [Candidatus Roizmanbacteria bacterium RIFCSPLOWO2_01_FULL_41_22]OGK58069.1 MAG: hypothetical protein A3H86_03285 [Candidatus Roizmanbacteria bacterium RIFCSPLOWO2_02_FULL_41_9]